MKRREFLNVISAAGAAGAASALTGCARGGGPEELTPYVTPEADDVLPGVSSSYATVCRECPAGCGMLALVRDERVHKVEGNPDHPVNRGKLCLRGHASLQGLYNPDRHRQPLARDSRGRLQPISWSEADRRLDRALESARSGHAAWIGQLETGPLDRLIDTWLRSISPSHTRLRYELYAYESLRSAAFRVFGRAAVPEYRIDRAHTIVSFGADFLETWISNVEYTRGFSAWRQARLAGKLRGRYLFFGPRLSLTGQNADEWIAIRPGTEGVVARALTDVLEASRRGAAPSTADLAAAASAAGVTPETLLRAGRELAGADVSIVLPPGTAQEGPDASSVHEAVLRLSAAAGNIGQTVFPDWPHALSGASTYADMRALIDRMQAGDVSVLFIHQADPAYGMPAAAGFAEAISRVPVVVSFSTQPDETTGMAGRTGGFASLVLPDHSPLESWGEYSPRPGVTGILQPVVPPVFDTRATGDILLTSAARQGRLLGAHTFKEYLQGQKTDGTAAWASTLQLGGVFSASSEIVSAPPGTTAAPPRRTLSSEPPIGYATAVFPLPPHSSARPTPATLPGPSSTPVDGLESPVEGEMALQLAPSLHLYDGRMANRPWAQEIPNAATEAVWGSWAEINPAAAEKLGVRNGSLLSIRTEHGSLEVPALLREGIRADVIAIEIGQGRTFSGRYAAEAGGVNPIAILPAAAEPESGGLPFAGARVNVKRLDVLRPSVVLQTATHEHGSGVARSTTLTELTRSPAQGFKEEGRPSLYSMVPVKQHPTTSHKWGMVIDLDRCVGCNACAAACYAENNVPVVGKEQCSRGREMSWLRVETYDGLASRQGQSGDPDPAVEQLDIRFYPSVCMQCDNAPCEYVCPVNATMHDDEGLNVQVYNRCVGTRYCSNNCPYKVRRFNWFTFRFESPLDQQLNPDVIHRTKGVMEKCTFCIQRIRRAEIDSSADRRPIRDGEIQTACMQSCPADAIIFGDQKDPGSVVHKHFQSEKRGYGALEDLNTYPNVQYLKRVRTDLV